MNYISILTRDGDGGFLIEDTLEGREVVEGLLMSDEYVRSGIENVPVAEFLDLAPADVPEPMPVPGKVDVLLEVIKDLESRDAVGTKKYGTTLQTNNGRNPLMDAYQEALDLAMYLKQALIEQDK